MNDRDTLVDGESVIGKVGVHKVLVCCDCGLVHDIWPSYDPSTKLVSIMLVRNDDDTRKHRASLRRKGRGVFKKSRKKG